MEPSRFGVDDERVGHPKLVDEATVQSQRLVGVVVGQAVIVPALPQEHGHGVILPRTTHTNMEAQSQTHKQTIRKINLRDAI